MHENCSLQPTNTNSMGTNVTKIRPLAQNVRSKHYTYLETLD